jgi:methionyl-tRNA formyltransferase
LRLGFAGTPEFSVPALNKLASEHEIAAVYTQPDRPAGRGKALRPSPVKETALALKLPLFQPLNFKSDAARAEFRALQLDALVVVAYGLILPVAVLSAPKLGCFNIHASLLPRWRGAAPIQRAILEGDQVSGVTIMRMEAGLDTGPMLLCEATPINSTDTAATLHDRLAAMGAKLMSDALRKLASNCLHETPQGAGASYAAKLAKSEAMIDWREDASRIDRKVRAFNPWPIAETRLNGAQLRILDATPLDQDRSGAAGEVLTAAKEGIDVCCGRGLLRIRRLQLAGRKALAAGEFLQGQSLAGSVLGAP